MVSITDAREVLCDPELVVIRDKWFERMQAVFDSGTDGRDDAFVLYGEQVGVEVVSGKDFQADLEVAVCELADKADALRDEKVFRPLIVGIAAYGVHFVDRMFGVHGFAATDESLRYVHNDVGELPAPDVENDPGWKAVREATLAYLDMGLTVPVLVGTCMSSPLNQAMNLYSERFLLAMLDNPEGARRDLRIITDVVKELHQWYLDTVPSWQLQGAAPTVRAQPPGYGQIDGCSTHLIGPGQYRDFIAELDNEVLSMHPKGGMIHLCGVHQRHIPTWAEMPALKSIQLSSVANESVQAYAQESRTDQVVYVGPSEFLALETIMDATDGGYHVVLAADIEAPLRRKR